MKYHLQEQEERMDIVDSIHASLENLMRVGGAKIKARKPRERLIKTEEQKEAEKTPYLRDILPALGGDGALLNINESELPKWQGKQLT